MNIMNNIGDVDDLQAIIDVIPNPVFVKNRAHRIVLLNSSACEFFGHSREVMLSSDDLDLFPAEQVAVFQAADDRVFTTGEDNVNEEQVTDAFGIAKTVVTRKRLIHLAHGEPFLVGVVTDVTAYREAEAHSRYLAFHDTLTGLPNRALLNERIDQTLSRTRRGVDKYALVYIDLDRFKEVNDTYGHPAGDELIRDFAGRLSSLVRASDTVARLGGDEFAMLLSDVSSPEEVEGICRRILDAAHSPFEVTGAQAFVDASIGVVMAPADDVSRTELQRRADVALYRAKNDGRGCYRFFTEEMDESIKRRRSIESELRRALSTADGLQLVYQPLLSSDSDRLMAMEALVRWNHPRLGMLLPTQFVPVAEETGLIIALGDWVLERACRTMRAWPGVSLAVNLSPVQLRDPGFGGRVLAILKAADFDPERLQLEITESVILNADEGVTETLRFLRRSGIKIALDDFGTGYSSLNHLRYLEVDKIKIDRSFVQHIDQQADSAAIVQAVASIGRTLGLCVTAEGVETDEQRQFLRMAGCDELQGYLLSRPLPEEGIGAYLATSQIARRVA